MLFGEPLWLDVVWGLSALAAGIIGSTKDEGCLGFAAGIFFGPLGVLGVLLSKGHRRPCPKCRESIHRKATRCPKCQAELGEGWA